MSGLIPGQDLDSALNLDQGGEAILQFANTSGIEADSGRVVEAMQQLHDVPIAPHLGGAVERAAAVEPDAPSVSQEAGLNLTATPDAPKIG